MATWTVDDASNDTTWALGNSWEGQDATVMGDGEWEDLDVQWEEFA